MTSRAVYLDLDSAFAEPPAALARIDATQWGPQLRFSAPSKIIEQFYAEIAPQLDAFVVYGSGDFHHLSALWLRRAETAELLISFDNHPDWDIRPPKWGCGSWINRALELPRVESVHVWGCGNFECWWPRQLWGNRRAERAGKLAVHPWADDRAEKQRARRGAILREGWRAKFEQFAATIRGRRIYITIDIDCLQRGVAATNWENGRFTIDDVVWAVGTLREGCEIVAGDMCGSYSVPKYARRKQRFASEADHPKLIAPNIEQARRINAAAIEALLPILTGGNQRDANGDDQRADDQLQRQAFT